MANFFRMLLVAGASGLILIAGCAVQKASGSHMQSDWSPLQPRFRYTPIYPPAAMVKGIQGTVNVCFTVKADGTVYKPYVKSASSKEARKYLGDAAVETISRWIFFPKVVNGKPVTADNVCQTISYGMN